MALNDQLLKHFNESARKCIYAAQAKADFLSLPAGAEHLVLVMMEQGPREIKELLKNFGLVLEEVQQLIDNEALQIIESISHDSGMRKSCEQINLILRNAVEAASSEDKRDLEPELLLVGVIDLQTGPIVDLMVRIGIDLDVLRSTILRPNYLRSLKDNSTKEAYLNGFGAIMIQEAVMVLKDDPSFESGLNICVNIIGKTMNCSRCIICINQSDRIQTFEFYDMVRAKVSCSEANWPKQDSAILREILQEKNPLGAVVRYGNASIPSIQEEMITLNSKSILATKLEQGENVIGSLMMHETAFPRVFSEKAVNWFQQMAKELSPVLFNRLVEES